MTRHGLATLLVGALLLGACGTSTDGTSPTTSPTETSTTAAPTPTPTPTDDGTDDIGDCSASTLTAAEGDFSGLPEDAARAAAFLLDAALRCDEPLLATAAAESDTTLTFGDADPYEFFGLPEGDDPIYAILVTLLTEVSSAPQGAGEDPEIHVWPTVATATAADDDAAWQEVVDAGLLTDDEATQMREAGAGYLGWRLGIRADGTWMFLVAGD